MLAACARSYVHHVFDVYIPMILDFSANGRVSRVFLAMLFQMQTGSNLALPPFPQQPTPSEHGFLRVSTLPRPAAPRGPCPLMSYGEASAPLRAFTLRPIRAPNRPANVLKERGYVRVHSTGQV